MSNIGLPMGPPQPKKKSAQDPDSAAAQAGTAVPDGQSHKTLKTVASAFGALVLFALAGIAVVALFGRSATPAGADFTGDGSGSVQVTIPGGATATDIGGELTNQGVVASTQAFVKAAAADPNSRGIQPGVYEMREQMSASSALALLLDPASRIVNKFTIPEGTRLTRVLTIASEATGIPLSDFESALEDPQSLALPYYAGGNAEGFLYPATYEFNDSSTAQDLLGQMVAAFNAVSKEINLEGRAADSGVDPYDVVIKASLVEAEGVPEDFPMVARVIENRLDEGMPLQFDSTSNFASDSSNIQLSQSQLAENTPFNTYLNKGLTPTPINQPGRAALEAALSPEPGPWLYFVATDPDAKITKFTESYDEHLRNVDEMFEKLRERGLQYQPD